MHINRTHFWRRNNYFWKVSIWHIIQNHGKKLALLWTLQFQFNRKTYPTRNFCLSDWVWTPNAYFCSKCYAKLPYLHRLAKCHIDRNVKMMFCVVMQIWMSPLTYWDLNFSSNILALQWLLGFMLVYIVVKKWNDISSQKGLSNYYS